LGIPDNRDFCIAGNAKIPQCGTKAPEPESLDPDRFPLSRIVAQQNKKRAYRLIDYETYPGAEDAGFENVYKQVGYKGPDHKDGNKDDCRAACGGGRGNS
jgi:hypothetical protein